MKSEIRDSVIDDLMDKVRGRKYGKYLLRVNLANARGFHESAVTFDFPVTAIIGPNGGGKTTVLGAAACAYRSIQPRRFFAKSGKFDDSMQDWKFEYEAIDREVNKTDSVRRTASFKRARWNRDPLNRDVMVFGVSRTVPASERSDLRRYASNKFTVPTNRISVLDVGVSNAVEKILGKDVSQFQQLRIDEDGVVTLLAGKTPADDSYSEFHFGAGESSIIRMVALIESLEENSLILIEEIENGLHPVATQRMVEYLIDVSRRKSCQFIFTTHSNDALQPLPERAIWVAIDSAIFQGKLDIRSLRAITGQVEAKLVIFVEDAFAQEWVKTALRYMDSIALDAIEVHAMAGDGTAVKVHHHHRLDPSARQPSVCVIDGDSEQAEQRDTRVVRLPGGSPERHVAEIVVDNVLAVSAKLAAALQLPVERQSEVARVVEDTYRTNRDPHIYFSQVGERLGLISESVVRGAFLAQWAQLRPSEVDALEQLLDAELPREGPDDSRGGAASGERPAASLDGSPLGSAS